MGPEAAIFARAWRSLANPQRHVHNDLLDVDQSFRQEYHQSLAQPGSRAEKEKVPFLAMFC